MNQRLSDPRIRKTFFIRVGVFFGILNRASGRKEDMHE